MEPVWRKARPELRVLDEHDELLVIGIIMENPTLYLDEVCKQILSITNITVAPSTINFADCWGNMASQEGESGRWNCREMMYSKGHSWHIVHCFLDKFVWLDETRFDGRDHIRKYRYALWGMRPVTHCFLSQGRRTNVIAAMSQDGVIALELVSGPVNGDIFFNFVSSSLIPMMMPFNGVNSWSVNWRKCLLQHAGIITLYLPPYTLDFNPAEEAFSYVRG